MVILLPRGLRAHDFAQRERISRHELWTGLERCALLRLGPRVQADISKLAIRIKRLVLPIPAL